jgi:hypothetical protein
LGNPPLKDENNGADVELFTFGKLKDKFDEEADDEPKPVNPEEPDDEAKPLIPDEFDDAAKPLVSDEPEDGAKPPIPDEPDDEPKPRNPDEPDKGPKPPNPEALDGTDNERDGEATEPLLEGLLPPVSISDAKTLSLLSITIDFPSNFEKSMPASPPNVGGLEAEDVLAGTEVAILSF